MDEKPLRLDSLLALLRKLGASLEQEVEELRHLDPSASGAVLVAAMYTDTTAATLDMREDKAGQIYFLFLKNKSVPLYYSPRPKQSSLSPF
jgi:hypothetical protein